VTRFHIDAAFATRYPVRQAGGETILKLWVHISLGSPVRSAVVDVSGKVCLAMPDGLLCLALDG
jgi:hypothetical protein